MTDPVIDLQERLTHQDSVIADLDEVVRDFAARVEQLERQVKVLAERVDDIGVGVANAIAGLEAGATQVQMYSTTLM